MTSQFIPFYITFGVLVIWAVAFKAIALWHAAKRAEKAWFVVMFIINTAGILPLVYLFRVMQKPVFLWLIGISAALFVILILELANLPVPSTIPAY